MQRNFSTKELGFTAPQNEQIEMALTYNFTSIDIDINEFGRQVQSRGMETARRLIDSAEIGIGTFRLPFALNEPDAAFQSSMQRLSALARAAQEIGAARCVAKVEPFSETLAMPENFELHRKRAAEVAAALGECGITLGLEFVAPAANREGKKFEFIHTFDELLSLADGLPNVGVVLDTWQLYACGVGVEALQKVKMDKLVCVRLGDAPEDVAPADLTLKHRMLPGETGKVDCPEFVKQLEAMGYTGPITPMCDGANSRGERRDQVAETAGLRMQKVWVAAGLAEPEPESLYAVTSRSEDGEDDSDADMSLEGESDAAAETEAANA